MNKLIIPNRPIAQCETVAEKTKLMLEDAAVAKIDQVNWANQFPASMPVAVRVAHDGENIYLYYEIEGEEVRAANTNDFGSVWEDSCVEFFMQKEEETTEYRNIECNIIGALLASYHKTRDTSEKLTQYTESILRCSTIQQRFENGKQLCDWTMYLEIPKEVMGFSSSESLDGKKIRANFYKCGDKTPVTHFLSWNKIDLPNPNFHAPQFFGLLELE